MDADLIKEEIGRGVLGFWWDALQETFSQRIQKKRKLYKSNVCDNQLTESINSAKVQGIFWTNKPIIHT